MSCYTISMGNNMTSQNVLTGLCEASYLLTDSGTQIYLTASPNSTEINPQFVEWLKLRHPFRYVPYNPVNKPITVRTELRKGQPYWYGFLRLEGKLHKQYVGQLSDLTYSTLETIAQSLNHPEARPKREPKVTQSVGQQSDLLPVLTDVLAKLNDVLDTPRNNFSKDKKAMLRSAIDSLAGLLDPGEPL